MDAPMHEELGRLIASASRFRRIDAQIGEKTVFGGNARQHPRRITFLAQYVNGLVKRIGEDARMAVGDRAGS